MPQRFDFALGHLEPSQWNYFEKLSRAFLADEFPAMRSLASESGDGGRDAMLFQCDSEPTVAIQMSVAKDWSSKIRSTVARLQTTSAGTSTVVYLTNQTIGPKADDLVREMRRDKHMAIDVRDRSWFVDREQRSAATRTASEYLCEVVVDPLLARKGIIDKSHETLSDQEARAALLYLVLQAEDDKSDRQLTKLCFDSLVKTALRSTNNENRLTRDQIYEWVIGVLSTHDETTTKLLVDRALERLDRRFIRHYRQLDEFCMNFDERKRLAEKVAVLARADENFDEEMASHLRFVASGMGLQVTDADFVELVPRARRVLEQFLFERGEAFVSSIRSGQSMLFEHEELSSLALRDSAKHAFQGHLRHNVSSLISESVERVLLNPTDDSQYFLRAVGDAYTLFAFLCETPNVQSAISKLFSQGEFWLDTSAVLPLLVDELHDESERRSSFVISAVIRAGAKVFVTEGVVSELLHHVERSAQAWRSPNTWNGRTPFLYSSYLLAGMPNADFPKWLDTFRGRMRPDVDLAEYLRDRHQIKVLSLADRAKEMDDTLRWHTKEYWYGVHSRRRNGSNVLDPAVIAELAERDIENFLGVLSRRKGEEIGNPFGYSTWWVSLTRASVQASREIQQRADLQRLDSPVLNYDFLTHYLAVSPARKQLEKSLEQRLPMMMDTSLLDAPPSTLLEMAENVRTRCRGQGERVIRREIRDQLEKEKLAQSRVGRAGMDALRDDFQAATPVKGRKQMNGNT